MGMRYFRCLLVFVVLALMFSSASPLMAGYDRATQQLQQKLSDLGYRPGPADGAWGKKTREALKAFQRDRGLKVSGRMDAETLKKLGLASSRNDRAVGTQAGNRGIPSSTSVPVFQNTERRVALVIGNGAYQYAGMLPNPPHDARAVAATLRGLMFDVVEGVDLDRAGMMRTIRRFSDQLKSADVGLFFYAGHGLQVNGKNYLAPVDARLQQESDLEFETLPMGLVMKQLERKKRVNLVFLDACRNNPLAENLARSMGLSRSAARQSGLAQERASVGTFIAYATQPGNTAADGEEQHSPFTEALLAQMAQPGVEIRRMITRVRQQVSEQTRGKQIPWDHSSLMGDFCLAGCSSPVISTPMQRVIRDDLSNVPGLSAAFRKLYRAAAQKASEGTESALLEAQKLARKLVAQAGSNAAADSQIKLATRITEELDRLVAERQERERAEAERRRMVAEERQRRLAEEQRRLDAERRKAAEERRAAEEEAQQLAEAEALKKKQKQVASLLLQARMLHAAGDNKAAAKQLSAARKLLPRDPNVLALMKVLKLEPDTWRDPTTGMVFVKIPGGCFQMGSNSGDSDEKPVHKVCVDDFWIGQYEVTQGQWQAVMGNNPSGFKKGDNFPVEEVSWDDAQQFFKKMRRRGSGSFRLPTEAEWEYACRSGGKQQKYCGGDDPDRVGWYDGWFWSNGDSGGAPHPVGTKSPNGLGLYDMSGNVWEWVQDIYAKDAYSQHARRDPIYEGSGSIRVSRGGSWDGIAWYLRSANRSGDTPDVRYDDVGLRVVFAPPGRP